MTTQTEALSIEDTLKLALEALEDNQHLVADNERHAYVMEYNDLIEKCKEALAQPEQEPVGFAVMQKPWVGLTDDEFEDIELGCRSTPFGKIEAMRMVEAKLKEKNI